MKKKTVAVKVIPKKGVSKDGVQQKKEDAQKIVVKAVQQVLCRLDKVELKKSEGYTVVKQEGDLMLMQKEL